MTFDDAGEGSPVPGNPSGFIAYQISIGASGRQSLAEWRDLGGTSADKAWYTLYGQVNDTIMRTDAQASLDPTQLPLPSDYATISMGAGGQYATQVNVTSIDAETGERGIAPYTYVTNEPHTPEEAEQAAIDEYGSDDNEERYGQTITGAYTVHLWETEPYGG